MTQEANDLPAALAEPSAPSAVRPELLQGNAIRARGRLGAIAFLYVWQVLSALVIATPTHAWAKRLWAAHPQGDAVLFQPGGFDLMTWLLDTGPAITVVSQTTLMLLIVSVFLAQVPLGVLLASLASRRGETVRAPHTRDMLRVALSSFAPFVVLLVVVMVVQGITLGAGIFLAGKIAQSLGGPLGDASAFFVQVGVVVLFVYLAGLAGAEADVARAGIVRVCLREEQREERTTSTLGKLRAGLRLAFGISMRARLLAFGFWTVATALGLGLIFAGALVANALGGRGGAALFALGAVHQLIVLARTGLRATWLAKASRLASEAL